jgi:Fe-S oxidoreductase
MVHPDALFACTTCMACVEVCPATIEIVDDIVDMRRYLALTEGALPGTSTVTLRNMGTNGNPWGYAQEERTKWAEGLEVPIATEGEEYELLYWVGCSGSYDQRNMKISRAFVKLLDAAGVRYAIMREESCTCESARRLGDEYLYQTATEVNVANLDKYSFERVVCHCPHCFNTIKNEFPQFGGDFEVIHHSQVLRELLEGGRLKVPAAAADAARVTFHDSCYLGRYNREFDAPRDSLRAVGVDVIEPPRTREQGLCCGGGGGKMWFEGQADTDVNLIRMEELLETKPDVVGVACPFCLTMMDDAKSTIGERAQDVVVRDVAEILAAALE